jgi:hypothetical protein
LGYESDFLRLIDKTSHFGIDIKAIPFAIYSPTLNDDLALFLGKFSFDQRLEPRASWKHRLKNTRPVVSFSKSMDQLAVLKNRCLANSF